jgi:hypothetical protein
MCENGVLGSRIKIKDSAGISSKRRKIEGKEK